jgi:hypothetical protein
VVLNYCFSGSVQISPQGEQIERYGLEMRVIATKLSQTLSTPTNSNY